MVDRKNNRVLSMRIDDEFFEWVEEFQTGQLARPSQTESIRALVRLGLNAWKALDPATIHAPLPSVQKGE